MNASGLKKSILELLYPTRARCLGCGDERGCSKPFLCDVCRVMLIPDCVVVSHEEWKQRHLSQVAYVYHYGRPIRGMIRAFKYSSVKMLAPRFAKEMNRLIRKRGLGPYDMIVPVPLHPSRLSARGFNQAQLLAEELSALCGIPVRTDVLFRTRKTKQQAKLPHEARRANVENAFEARVQLDGMRVLMLDDVITTGSTICAGAEALHEAGALDVQAISVAGMHTAKVGKPVWKKLHQNGKKLRPAASKSVMNRKKNMKKGELPGKK